MHCQSVDADLQIRSQMFADVGASAGSGAWVALFYCKAIQKKQNDLRRIYNAFGTKIVVIRDRLTQIEDDSSLRDDVWPSI